MRSDIFKKGLMRDKKLSNIITSGKSKKILGFCQVCKLPTFFLLDSLYSDNNGINFRERMVCRICRLNNRQRFLLGETLKRIKPYENCKIYLYEKVTSFYEALAKRCPNIIGSEYLGSQYEGGTVINGIQHEDSTCLSFPDESFDMALSLDVFEHVFDLEKSFKEAFRILKPMGRMIFSIPFYIEKDITEKRAEMIDGNIIFLKEPQYHGNPISEKGSLVVYDISWDCFDMVKKCGFSDVYLVAGYSRITGNIGSLQYFFEAIK
jgi:SAM-dependent methyltransferase